MEVKKHIPCTVRIAGEFIRFWYRYPGQPKTCRRCGDLGHLIKECQSVRCFNCEQSGHQSEECEMPHLCSICRSADHMLHECPYFCFSANVSVTAQTVQYTSTTSSYAEAAKAPRTVAFHSVLPSVASKASEDQREKRRKRRKRWKRDDPVNCLRNHHVEVMNVGGSGMSVIIGIGAASAIRIAIVIESVKESASGTGIGAITTGVNARATRIATDRKTTIGSGATEAMRDPVKVLILRVGRRCDTKVGINIIIISFISLKLFTLNVCGLVTPAKRDSVLHELSLLDLDTILLQETHVSNKTQADEISKRWSGDCFWFLVQAGKPGLQCLSPRAFKGKFQSFYLILMVGFSVL